MSDKSGFYAEVRLYLDLIGIGVSLTHDVVSGDICLHITFFILQIWLGYKRKTDGGDTP